MKYIVLLTLFIKFSNAQYYEKTWGFGDSTVSLAECQQFADEREGSTVSVNTGSSTDPVGCFAHSYATSSTSTYYFNDDTTSTKKCGGSYSLYTCLAKTVLDTGDGNSLELFGSGNCGGDKPIDFNIDQLECSETENNPTDCETATYTFDGDPKCDYGGPYYEHTNSHNTYSSFGCYISSRWEKFENIAGGITPLSCYTKCEQDDPFQNHIGPSQTNVIEVRYNSKNDEFGSVCYCQRTKKEVCEYYTQPAISAFSTAVEEKAKQLVYSVVRPVTTTVAAQTTTPAAGSTTQRVVGTYDQGPSTLNYGGGATGAATSSCSGTLINSNLCVEFIGSEASPSVNPKDIVNDGNDLTNTECDEVKSYLSDLANRQAITATSNPTFDTSSLDTSANEYGPDDSFYPACYISTNHKKVYYPSLAFGVGAQFDATLYYPNSAGGDCGSYGICIKKLEFVTASGATGGVGGIGGIGGGGVGFSTQCNAPNQKACDRISNCYWDGECKTSNHEPADVTGCDTSDYYCQEKANDVGNILDAYVDMFARSTIKSQLSKTTNGVKGVDYRYGSGKSRFEVTVEKNFFLGTVMSFMRERPAASIMEETGFFLINYFKDNKDAMPEKEIQDRVKAIKQTKPAFVKFNKDYTVSGTPTEIIEIIKTIEATAQGTIEELVTVILPGSRRRRLLQGGVEAEVTVQGGNCTGSNCTSGCTGYVHEGSCYPHTECTSDESLVSQGTETTDTVCVALNLCEGRNTTHDATICSENLNSWITGNCCDATGDCREYSVDYKCRNCC